MLITCGFCGKESNKSSSAARRAERDCKPIFCNRKCFVDSRRMTKAEKVELKRLYDIEYRNKNRDTINQRKREFFKKNYDPVKAAIERKKTMHRHVEYCRRPEYVEKKKVYDRSYKAKLNYGELWEVHVLTLEIQDEVLSKMSRYQIDLESNTLNKKQRRTRDEKRTNSEEFERSSLGHIDQR